MSKGLREARRALADGDVARAARRLGDVLASDPSAPAALAMLRAFDREAAARLVDATVEASTAGEAAVVAWLAWSLGRREEALQALSGAQLEAPEVDYLGWLSEWLEDEPSAAQLDGDAFVARVWTLAERWPPEEGSPRFARLLEALERVADAQPEHPGLSFARCALLRRHGLREEALELALAQDRRAPCFEACVALAAAHRAVGEPNLALHAYRRALIYRPDDVPVRRDIGDLLAEDLGEIDAAIATYQEALELDPDDAWCLPSALFLRARHLDDADARARLGTYALAHPENDRARRLAADELAFEVDLPPREEAILGFAHLGGLIPSVALSSLEAPSAVASFERARGPLRLTVSEIPHPDPRLPEGTPPFVLWTYEETGLWARLRRRLGVRARPAVDPPSADLARGVAELAAQPYAPDDWWDGAAALATLAGTERARELAAVMVHPPETREPWPAWDWRFRCQVAAALAIARLDDAWPGIRAETLFAILDGPIDWTCSAAMAALTELSNRDPSLRRALQERIADAILRSDTPIGGSCLVRPGVALSLRMRDLPPELATQLRRLR